MIVRARLDGGGILAVPARSAVEVVARMRRTPEIERRSALGASACTPVRLNRQLSPAHPAQDGILVPRLARPLPRGMVSGLAVAEVARIVLLAASEANGDDVELGRVVHTPGVLIDRLSVDLGRSRHHTPAFLCLGACPSSAYLPDWPVRVE